MASHPQRARLRLVGSSTGSAAALLDPEPTTAEAAAATPEPAWVEVDPVPPAPASSTVARKEARESRSEGRERTSGLAALADAQLVVLGAKGETLAKEQLYRRHAAFAINLATRIEGSARDVEDIVHDAFLRAFDRLGDLSDPAAFRGWLGSIVVHAVRSRMRRHRLMSVLGLRSADPVDLDALASPNASPHVRAQLAQVYALLRTLSADDRIAWTLRVVEGHDLDTVARLTDCSLATVKRRISRAQKFLDEHFVALESNPKETAQ